MFFAFGPFELRLSTCELRCGGRNVRVQPRVFGVLRYLIEHRERVVAKQELIDALWGGDQLNAVAVPWAINRARKALGDQPNGSLFIETVRGHGYRFVAEVEARSDDAAHRPGTEALARTPLERPFVGRTAVIQQLTASLEAALAGRGRLCLLTGEAGIGKTRCVSEFANIVRRRGLRVWVGRCFQHGIAPAFWPFVQVLRAGCADPSLHESARSEGEALLREFEPRPQELSPAGVVRRPDGEQFWLLDRLSRWLCHSALSQARVIEIEDIHCADDSSLQVLHLLAPMLAQARLVVVVTARDLGAASRHPVSSLVAQIHPTEHVALAGLQPEDIADYVRAELGDRAAAELSRSLSARTAGNPLFLQEVMRVVSTRYVHEGSVCIEDLPLPAAVSDIIRARLREFAAPARELLDVACVLGDELSLAVLQRACRSPAKAMLERLQTAVLANILQPRGGGSKYGFVHPLMREVLYSALSATQRAELHGAVAEALEVVQPALNELAYHFHHAPLEPYYERAARYGRLAGDSALRAHAYDDAVQFYAWALEAHALDAPDDVSATCELLIASASALMLAGRGAEGRNCCQRAIGLARLAKLPEMLVRAARQLRPSIWLAHIPDPDTVSALEEALQLLPEAAVDQRALASAQLAVIPPYSLRMASCQRMTMEALRLARLSDDPKLLLEAQVSRLFALCGPTTIDEQLAVADDMLTHDPKRYFRWATDAHLARYHAYMQRGDSAAAEQALDALAQLAQDLRLPFTLWHAQRLRAQRLLCSGRLDEAERRFEELWVESQRMKLPLAIYYRLAERAKLNFERTGTMRAARGGELAKLAPWVRAWPTFRSQTIAAALAEGDKKLALHEFRALADHNFAAVTDDVFALEVLVRLASASVALEERDAALLLRDLLAPHAELSAITHFTYSLGSVHRYLGELELFVGRRAQARNHIERAIDANARAGHELERLRSMLSLAHLLAQGRASERARAREFAATVATTARDFGARVLAERADVLLRPMAGSVRQLPRRAKSARTDTQAATARRR